MLADNPYSMLIKRHVFEIWYERFNKEKPKLPPNCAYVECFGSEKRYITWEEVMKERKEKQKRELSVKRSFIITEWKPGYIWVFCNPQAFPFGGWYCYIVTLKQDWGINFRSERDENQQEKVMRLFPCDILPVRQNFNEWMERFEKLHHFNSVRKKDGKARIWCKIEGTKLIDIEITKP